MPNDAVITLVIKDQASPVLDTVPPKAKAAAQAMAQDLAQGAARAESALQQLSLALRGGAAAATTTQKSHEDLIRTGIAEQQAWQRLDAQRAQSTARLAIEERAVRQTTAGYSDAKGFLDQYGSAQDKAGQATRRHGSAMGALSRHTGIITSALPGAGAAVSGFAAVLQGASAPLTFMTVALGLLIEQWTRLREVNLAYIHAATRGVIELDTARLQAAARHRRTEAESAAESAKLRGDELGALRFKQAALRAAADEELAGIEKSRRDRIQQAEERFQQEKGWMDGKSIVAALEKAKILEVDIADAIAMTERKQRRRDLNAELLRLAEQHAVESAKVHRAAELERLQTTEAIERQIAEARRGASGASAAAAARAAGSPLQELRAGLEERRAALQKSFDDQVRMWERAVLEGKMLDSEFFASRQALVETTNQLFAAAITDTTTKQKQGIAELGSAVVELFERLQAPGTETFLERLTKRDIVQKAAKDFQLLANVLEEEDDSAAAVGEAVRLLTENLLAQGATVAQISRVVPEPLKNLTSLFRDSSGAATTVTTNLEALGRDGGAALRSAATEAKGLWQWLRDVMTQAEDTRRVLLTLATAASMIPRIGMTEPPGADALTPRVGVTVEPGPTAQAPRLGMTVNIDARGASAHEIAEKLAEAQRRGEIQ